VLVLVLLLLLLLLPLTNPPRLSRYDELAASGHPVALRLRLAQTSSLNDLWKRAGLPDGDPARLHLPARCNREWFASTFCSGADLSTVGLDASIWPYVTSVNMYDPLTLLAAVPRLLKRFFNVSPKNVGGVEHYLVGKTAAEHGVRDPEGIRLFLLDALRYALTASLAVEPAAPDLPSKRRSSTVVQPSVRRQSTTVNRLGESREEGEDHGKRSGVQALMEALTTEGGKKGGACRRGSAPESYLPAPPQRGPSPRSPPPISEGAGDGDGESQ